MQREANAALEAYDARGKNLKSHFFHTLGRDFSNNASAAEVLLEFLPQGEYSFILCGALTLVFNVGAIGAPCVRNGMKTDRISRPPKG